MYGAEGETGYLGVYGHIGRFIVALESVEVSDIRVVTRHGGERPHLRKRDGGGGVERASEQARCW